MITKDEALRNICENYELVENYKEALSDDKHEWVMHHRNGVAVKTDELIRLGLYFKRPAGEFIFLTRAEHNKLHNKFRLQYEFSHAFEGKKFTEDHRNKISNALKGRVFTQEWKNKISKAKKDKSKGLKWFNNGIKSTMAKECPEGFVEGRLKRVPNK